MCLHMYCCRYGLIIPKKTARSKPVVNPLSVFGNDEEDDQVCDQNRCNNDDLTLVIQQPLF